jgi:hypothetical protein
VKKINLLFFLLFSSTVFSQEKIITDSLLYQMCNYLTNSDEENDSIRVSQMYWKYLPSVEVKEKDVESVINYMYVRLQKICPEFRTIVSAAVTDEYWQEVSELPETTISNEDFDRFVNGRISYCEPEGDTVNVSIKKNTWIEKFSDGTESKLKFTPKENGEFELEFIKSSNVVRKNYSKPGDTYRYRIYEVKGNLFFYGLYMENSSFLISSFIVTPPK